MMTNNSSATSPGQASVSATIAENQREQPISQLAGDRACIKCHFNLAGQSIVREPHYNLLIVRCPECGTPAALQEYPALGRWAPRLAYACAACWIMLLVFGTVFASGVFAMLSYPTGYLFSTRMKELVRSEAKKHIWSLSPDRAQNEKGIEFSQDYRELDVSWWLNQSPHEFIQAHGGYLHVLNWQAAWTWLPLGMTALIGGVCWAALLPRLRGRGAVIFTAIVLLLATPMLLIEMVFEKNAYSFMNGVWQIEALAARSITNVMVFVSLCICGLAFFLGMLLGRRVARFLITLLLPPRLWIPFAFLWTSDNLPLPKPTRA